MKPVAWSEIEHLMHRSIRGEGLSEDETLLLRRAYARHPAKYSALHKAVKKVEDDRMAMRDPK